MKELVRVCAVVMVVASGGIALAETPDAQGVPSALSEDTRFLWEKMRDAGMIDAEQYAHVIQTGRLPGGSIVQQSPLDADRQSSWTRLAEAGIVTPVELASMLFEGKVPDLEQWEIAAFEDLAPVYQPDRRKRLEHSVRRKHQRVESIRLSHRLSRERNERLAEVHARAERENIPIVIRSPDGEEHHLEDIVNGIPQYIGPLNAVAAQTIATDKLLLPAYGFGLSGSDVIIGLWDGGIVRTSHQEFAEGQIVPLQGSSLSPHATQVAGTLGAIGVQASAKGMAPDASIHVRLLSTGSLSSLASAIAATNMFVSNHSYGNQQVGWWTLLPGWSTWLWCGDMTVSTWEDLKHGLYNSRAREVDAVVHAGVFHLPVWAAGNERSPQPQQPIDHKVYVDNVWVWTNMLHSADGGERGFDTLLDFQTAKNSLVVGAVNDIPGGYQLPQDVAATAFSSFGPTDDGRIKPDVVANGAGLFTPTSSSDTAYSSPNGTSFSSPSVAGSVALLVGLHATLYGPDRPLLASTLRALVIHTTDEAGTDPGPDYKFGWGLMNSYNAALVLTNNAAWNSLPHIKEVALNDGEYVEFDVLASTGTPLRVTMAWTDPAGPVQPYALNPTNLVLVNDLDLRVICPNGSTNYPWTLDPFNPTNAASRGDNFRDNVEQLLIEDPTNGCYTVRASHKGTLSNSFQDVSFIITGNTPAAAPDFLISEIGVLGTNGVPIQLAWPGVVGALYQIMTSTNLLESAGWSDLSYPISANVSTMQWEDNSSSDEIRFYRLERLR